jgi:RNA polymerase sigma-70 factor (ECF subfamily)
MLSPGSSCSAKSDDASLMNRLRLGDAAAWHQMADKFRHQLRELAASALPRDVTCRADASDMVQQTFAEANESIAAFRGNSLPELFEWLAAILQNNIRDAVRTHVLAERRSVKAECRLEDSSQRHAHWESFIANQTPPGNVVHRDEVRRRLLYALQCLPARQRDAVRLRHLDGRPLDDIAFELGCTKQAAAALIARGLRGLRSALQDLE